MLKTTTGKASDLESALLAAIQGYNDDTGTKEVIDSHFLYDAGTSMYVIIIMYTQYEQVEDLPPQTEDTPPRYIGHQPLDTVYDE